METLKAFVCSSQSWFVQIFMVLLMSASLAGCRDLSTADVSPPPPLTIRTHLPGTVLRDDRGVYWMVMTWPERARIPEDQRLRAHIPEDAPPLNALEAACLRDRGAPWAADVAWQLTRLPDGAYVYLDNIRRLLRGASTWVIQARRDDQGLAPAWSGTVDELRRTYRDVGPMPLPEGSLLRTEDSLFFFFGGRCHPFLSEDLARAAGYRPEAAVVISEYDRIMYGEMAPVITMDTFATCPVAAMSNSHDEDRDGDGVASSQDCDDQDPNRAPGLEERCDGVDNNCDGIIDDGFMVGLPCVADDGCNSPGITQCTYDRWGVRCDNDEAVCK